MKVSVFPIQYFVEGECEEHLIKSIKNEYLLSGKIKVLNVTTKKITPNHIRLLKAKTICVFVLDVDIFTNGKQKDDILKENIKILTRNKFKVILIPQIQNLEDEIIYSTNIKKCCTELLGTVSKKDFKADFIKCQKIVERLSEKQFDINRFWTRAYSFGAISLANDSSKIKR